jgi:hypothetical protein
MDDETRFLIVREVAETKEKHDARMLFMRAKRLMGKTTLKYIITDGLASYAKAAQWALDGTQHIREITLKGQNSQQQKWNA